MSFVRCIELSCVRFEEKIYILYAEKKLFLDAFSGLKMVPMGSKPPLITVIIAAYNSAKTLRWTLLSVQAQEFQDFEVRVIGDGCTDESSAVVSSFNDPRFHWTNLPSNSGSQSKPNNQGLLEAQGTYIAYLGHDDLWFPWHLSRMLSCLEGNQADFVFSLCAYFGPEGIRHPVGPPLIGEKNLADHFTPPSSWLHRRDLIDSCGLWRCDVTKLHCPVDTDFWRWALKNNKRFYFCPVLSVLKFPSPWFKSYQRTSDYPQEPFLTSLFKTPHELHAEVLTQIALYALARQPRRRVWWKQGLVSLIEFYGRERFPFYSLFRWRFQRKRRQAWLQRGLPPSKARGVCVEDPLSE
jgi:glycosyltransferase involved in cell wall biosynthesis